MSTWWTGTLVVEVAFDDAPLTATASCTWTDVTTYVRGVSINRGRTSELSTYSPGTATVLLDNLTRVFDPSNSAGAYYGKLLPMKRIRVRAAIGVTSATVFAGYVLGWPISYPGLTDSVVSVACVDGMRVLEQTNLPASAYELAVMADSPSYYWQMQGLDDADLLVATAGNVDLPPGQVFVGGITPAFEVSTVGLAPLGASNSLNAGRATATISGLATMRAVEVWMTQLTNSSTSVQVRTATSSTDYIVMTPTGVFYSNSSDNKTLSGGVATIDAWANAWSNAIAANNGQQWHLAVAFDSSNMYAYLNGTLVQTTALTAGTTSVSTFTSVPSISIYSSSADHGLSHAAFYATAPSSTRFAAHYAAATTAYGHPTGEATGTRIGRVLDAVGWPTADRSLSTGTTVVGRWLPDSASAMSACRSLEATEQGLFFIGADGSVVLRDRQWQMTNSSSITSTATFGDSGSEIPYTDVTIDGNLADYIRNVVSVTYGGATVQAKDSTSITAYGNQSESVSAPDLPTWGGWLARQLAAFRVRLRKDPATRIPGISVAWRKNLASYLPTRLNMELGERVTVNRRPSGGTGSLSLACTVQGIRDEITPDNWTSTLYLSPAPDSYTEGPYLTMGDATYGKIGATAGNLVPY